MWVIYMKQQRSERGMGVTFYIYGCGRGAFSKPDWALGYMISGGLEEGRFRDSIDYYSACAGAPDRYGHLGNAIT